MPSKLFAPDVLAGQVALVSGGGSGLGRATAVELAACGAHVVVCGRRQEPLDETVAICDEGRCTAITCDIREEEQVEALVEGALKQQRLLVIAPREASEQDLATIIGESMENWSPEAVSSGASAAG